MLEGGLVLKAGPPGEGVGWSQSWLVVDEDASLVEGGPVHFHNQFEVESEVGHEVDVLEKG